MRPTAPCSITLPSIKEKFEAIDPDVNVDAGAEAPENSSSLLDSAAVTPEGQVASQGSSPPLLAVKDTLPLSPP